MRLVVKKWGLGLAVRLPRRSKEIGTIQEGMELEVRVRPVKDLSKWKPATFKGGPADLLVTTTNTCATACLSDVAPDLRRRIEGRDPREAVPRRACRLDAVTRD